MKKIKLSKFEQEIEDTAEEYVPASEATKKKFRKALDIARKTRSITLRIRENDLGCQHRW